MPMIPFKEHTPQVAENVFIAPDAWVIGKVTIAENVSLFFGTVVRGDIQAISIGSGSNLQEHSVVHTSTGMQDCRIGKHVTVGHHAIIHGCTIEDSCIIGMGATVLDGALVGTNSLVGANALVPMHMQIPPRSLVLGVPARVVRRLEDDELKQFSDSARHYVELASYYRSVFA